MTWDSLRRPGGQRAGPIEVLLVARWRTRWRLPTSRLPELSAGVSTSTRLPHRESRLDVKGYAEALNGQSWPCLAAATRADGSPVFQPLVAGEAHHLGRCVRGDAVGRPRVAPCLLRLGRREPQHSAGALARDVQVSAQAVDTGLPPRVGGGPGWESSLGARRSFPWARGARRRSARQNGARPRSRCRSSSAAGTREAEAGAARTGGAAASAATGAPTSAAAAAAGTPAAAATIAAAGTGTGAGASPAPGAAP